MIDDVLYGSKLRVFQVARNFKNNVFLDMIDIFKVCPKNFAWVIHTDELASSIESWEKARFVVVVVDDDYNISKVILLGKVEVEN